MFVYPIATVSIIAQATILCLVLWFISRRFRRHSLAHLPGPPPGPWIVGNNAEMYRGAYAGEADDKWVKEYGLALRTKAPFNEDILYLADPKALQYILNTRGYKFPKTLESRQRIELVTGKGIVWEEGASHAQQRKIMNPAFSHSALRRFMPLFYNLSRKLAARWKDTVVKGTEASVVDISPWMSRTTMDVVCEVALDYKSNSLEGHGSELTEAYHGFLTFALAGMSDISLAIRRLMGYMPTNFDVTAVPSKDIKRINQTMTVIRRIAKELVETKVKAQAGKEGGKDVMSILIKANMTEDKKKRLTDFEIREQITTLLLAGHETSSTSLNWILYELAQHPEAQRKVREEIQALRAESDSASPNGDLSVGDLDNMPYTQAVIKETLRFRTNLNYIDRTASQDDVIPLMIPQHTLSGETVTSIPVSKGQNICISFHAYNHLKQVWGEDADIWRPERFLEELPNTPTVGVIANIGTFSSGLRACVGWRFAVLEIQTIVITLIENFEFSPAPGVKVKPITAGMLTSVVEGREAEGTQMPLSVRAIRK